MRRACRPLTAWRLPATLICAAGLLAPGVTRADTCSGLAFGTPVSKAIPAAPLAVAVGDFNRDGKADVITTGTDGKVSFLAGDGAGGLLTAVTIATLINPVDVVAVDYNRDGKLDLVVANGSSTSVSLLPGAGDGTFGSATTLDLGTSPALVPTRLAIGDFNRDGRPDLVALGEASGRVRVFNGNGSGFGTTAAADLTVASPSSAVVSDFNHDGKPDLAVAKNAVPYGVAVFLGTGTALSSSPLTSAVPGTSPVDLATGDLNRDGKPDLVTANNGSADVSVLLGVGDGTFTASDAASIGGTPRRVLLLDLDRDGALDLAVLDDTGHQIAALRGRVALPPAFETTAYPVGLGAVPSGLAKGDFGSDGRPDLVTAVPTTPTSQVVVVPDASGASGSACARSSFGDAPRSYAAGHGPVAVAVADFNSDGRPDLAVVDYLTPTLALLEGTANGFVLKTPTVSLGSAPRGVAAADFDSDGVPDVAVALGGEIRLYRGDGLGGFSLSATQSAGANAAAVVVGDFNGDGAPDAAVASEGSNAVFVFLGNGTGGLGTGTSITVGTAPRALVAADFDGDGKLDLAVACYGSNNVWILQGNGSGGFSPLATKPSLGTGAGPWGITAADLDWGLNASPDGKVDLVTANHDAGTVSVLRGNGDGTFASAVAYSVSGTPTAVAALDVAGTARQDLLVSAAATHTVSLLVDSGGGTGYTTPATLFAARTSPEAVVPVDVDGDGQADLAVPCRDSDAVVVLMVDRSMSPPISTARTVSVGTNQAPVGAISADIDGDGDLDLVVANSAGNSLSLLLNDGTGLFPASPPTVAVGKAPESIVAADFNRDGTLDLAVNSPGETLPSLPGVSILLGIPAAPGTFQPYVKRDVGTTPDALAAGDFDRDGDVDLAVCDAMVSGRVRILLNDGSGGFTLGSSITVGNKPTAIVAADLNRDGKLDLAVVDDDSDDVWILLGNGDGTFTASAQSPIALTTNSSPVSIAAADLDGDGDLDLAVACFGTNELRLLRNDSGQFTLLPPVAVPDLASQLVAADVNRDGKADLALAATGLKVLRGKGAMAFEDEEQFVGGRSTVAVAIADFNRDGRPDAALVNKDSNDVSILLSTTCTAQRLGVSVSPPGPPACGGGAPYAFPATVQALDDGGNVAACTPGGTVSAAIVDDGGTGGVLGGTTMATLNAGQAAFAGLTIDRPGKRYRLGFTLSGLPPAISRRFTLGNELAIAGPASFCASSGASYSGTAGYDTYSWTKDANPTPFAFAPTIQVRHPQELGSLGMHTLSLTARVDSCLGNASNPVYVGDLVSVSLFTPGFSTVCVDCIGGTVTPTELGGGAVVARQWGYRTQMGGTITDLPFEAGPTYTIKGTDFPGPGDYWLVVKTTATCPAGVNISDELPVTVYEAPPSGEVLSLGVRSGGAPGDGQDKLFWVNADATADEILIRWRKAPTANADCVFPASPTGPPPSDGGDMLVTDTAKLTAVRTEQPITGLELDRNHCYAVFVHRSTGWSGGRLVKGRPFDALTGPVKWAYATGATAVVPPTIGPNGILAVSNDRSVLALTRGSTGGDWPPSPWVPPALSGVAHSRSPIVPFDATSALFPGKSIFFTTDDTGSVFAIDTLTGHIEWSSAPSTGTTMTGAPGAILTNGGAPGDLVLVGSRNTQPATLASEFYRLALGDGLTLTPVFTGNASDLGPINGTPAVDAGARRVMFVSRRLGAGHTIWCLNLPESGDPTVAWSRGDLGEFDSSPVIRSGRAYVANDTVYSLDAASGGGVRSFPTGDGLVKGFVFPDRRGDDLIFATDHKVVSISDDGGGATGMTENWEWTLPAGGSPSLVLYWPETNFVYVGGPGGTLYELDFTSADSANPPAVKEVVLGDGSDQVGAPSLDRMPPGAPGGQGLLVVGSESGVLYGVEVPLPPP
jgi:FG-GAP-like repeat/PQQ-like domain